MQVFSSHNFFALRHWLLLLRYLQSCLKFRSISDWEQVEWKAGRVLQPERLCSSGRSTGFFPSHFGIDALTDGV